MVISKVPRLESIRRIKSKENAFHKFKEEFYSYFFLRFKRLE